nr:unnamed protein product [Callosobruchus analis]
MVSSLLIAKFSVNISKLLSSNSKKLKSGIFICYRYKMCDKTDDIIEKTKRLAPPLTNDKHKGQAGRIAVFGGSIEFTGAPYFASISALKTGADLVYLFTNKEPATVIKSYSPELMVLPLLDDPQAIEKIEPWLERLHVVVIGPGLGRHNQTFKTITQVIETCRRKSKPLVSVRAKNIFCRILLLGRGTGDVHESLGGARSYMDVVARLCISKV